MSRPGRGMVAVGSRREVPTTIEAGLGDLRRKSAFEGPPGNGSCNTLGIKRTVALRGSLRPRHSTQPMVC